MIVVCVKTCVYNGAYTQAGTEIEIFDGQEVPPHFKSRDEEAFLGLENRLGNVMAEIERLGKTLAQAHQAKAILETEIEKARKDKNPPLLDPAEPAPEPEPVKAPVKAPIPAPAPKEPVSIEKPDKKPIVALNGPLTKGRLIQAIKEEFGFDLSKEPMRKQQLIKKLQELRGQSA